MRLRNTISHGSSTNETRPDKNQRHRTLSPGLGGHEAHYQKTKGEEADNSHSIKWCTFYKERNNSKIKTSVLQCDFNHGDSRRSQWHPRQSEETLSPQVKHLKHKWFALNISVYSSLSYEGGVIEFLPPNVLKQPTKFLAACQTKLKSPQISPVVLFVFELPQIDQIDS